MENQNHNKKPSRKIPDDKKSALKVEDSAKKDPKAKEVFIINETQWPSEKLEKLKKVGEVIIINDDKQLVSETF